MSRAVIKQIGLFAGFITIPLMIVLAIGLIATRRFEWYILLGLAVLLVAVAVFAATNPELWQRQLGRQRVSSTISGLVVIVALVGIIVLINVLLQRTNFQFDVTKNKNFTISDTSIKVVEKFKDPVVATILYDSTTQDQQTRAVDLLKQYATRNDKLTYQSVNAAVDPLAVQRYNVKSNPAIVFEQGQRREQVSSIDEQTFTRTLLKLQNPTARRVLIMSGHQELSTTADQQGNSLATTVTALTDNNFQVEIYNSLTNSSVSVNPPAGATAAPTPVTTELNPANDILLIAGPRGKFTADEKNRIVTFLKRGGKALIAYDINSNVDPAQATNLNDLLTDWGVKFNRGVIIETDRNRRTSQTPLELVPNINSASELASGLSGSNQNVVALLSTSIDKGTTTATYTDVLNTSNDSYLKINLQSQTSEFEQGDTRGPLTVVATLQDKAKEAVPPASATPATTPGATPTPAASTANLNTRIVLMGSPSVISDYGLNRSVSNTTFFVNAMNYLNETSDSVVITSRTADTKPFQVNDSQSTVAFWSSFLGVPLLIMFLGLVAWWRRR